MPRPAERACRRAEPGGPAGICRGMWRIPYRTDPPEKTPGHRGYTAIPERARERLGDADAAGIHIPRNTAPGVSGGGRGTMPVRAAGHVVHTPVRAAGGVPFGSLPDCPDGSRSECGGCHTMASPPYSTRFTGSLERRYEVLSMRDPAVCVPRTNHTRVRATAVPAGGFGPERAGSAQCCRTVHGCARPLVEPERAICRIRQVPAYAKDVGRRPEPRTVCHTSIGRRMGGRAVRHNAVYPQHMPAQVRLGAGARRAQAIPGRSRRIRPPGMAADPPPPRPVCAPGRRRIPAGRRGYERRGGDGPESSAGTPDTSAVHTAGTAASNGPRSAAETSLLHRSWPRTAKFGCRGPCGPRCRLA